MGRNSLFRRFVCILILPAILTTVPLHADLGDFGEDVEEEQEEGPDKRDKPKGSWPKWPEWPEMPEEPDYDYPEPEEPPEEDSSGFGFGLLALFISAGWFAHNVSSVYTLYPYGSLDLGGSPGKTVFVTHYYRPGSTDGDNQDVPVRGLVPKKRPKTWRGSFITSGGFFFEGTDIGVAAAAEVSTMFYGILGPEAGYRLWSDKSGELHRLRFGGVLPVMQFDQFSLSIPMDCDIFFGVFDLVGFAVGGLIKSYPKRPLSVELRGGAIIAPELIFGEFSGRLSMHAYRFEFFSGYHGLYHAGRGIHTVEFGVGVNW